MLIFVLFLVLIGLTSSMSFGVRPPSLDFVGEVNQEICKNITVYAEGLIFVLGEDNWAEKGFVKRDLLKHNLDSDSLDLELDYLERFSVNEVKTVSICIIGGKKGVYHGVLLYHVEDGTAGVGTWLNVELEGNGIGLVRLTGSVIGVGKRNSKLFLLMFFVLLEIILLGILLSFRK